MGLGPWRLFHIVLLKRALYMKLKIKGWEPQKKKKRIRTHFLRQSKGIPSALHRRGSGVDRRTTKPINNSEKQMTHCKKQNH